jgi:uncharacterized protein
MHYVLPVPNTMIPECRECGACCCNPADNKSEGYYDWVEVAKDEPVRKGRRTAHLVVVADDGSAHMRLDPSGRCVALRGKLGQSVNCSIYEVRPRPCHRVEAGSKECLRHRESIGL